MSNPQRKIVNIDAQANGRPASQLILARQARLQAVAWAAHSEATVGALEIEQIAREFGIEDGDLLFDFDRKMVRSRTVTNPAPPTPRPRQEVFDFDERKEPGSAGPVPSREREVGS